MPTSMSTAELLRVARLRKGLTQAEAAEELKVHPMTYGSWERGKATPHPVNIGEIARFFEIDPALFVDDVSAQHAINFGALLRRRRKEEQLSVEELASWVGRSSRTVEAWERGEYVPNDDNIKTLERILGHRLELEAVKPVPIKLERITEQCTRAWHALTPEQQAMWTPRMDAACEVINGLARTFLNVQMPERM